MLIKTLKSILRKSKQVIFPTPIIIKEFNTYSQAGEDAIVCFLLLDKKVDSVSYLDIGCCSPDHCNNTFLLYKKGFRGVCVEADQTLIPYIKQVRPEDKVIYAGVSSSNLTEGDFYVFDSCALSTFSKADAENRIKHGSFKINQVIKVPLISINEIIKDNFSSYPVFLSIDTEGLDLEILKSLDFDKYPIPIICAETCAYSENNIRPKDQRVAQFMTSKGYNVYGDTYINTIFVNTKWFLNT